MTRIIYAFVIAFFPLVVNAQQNSLNNWFNSMEWFNHSDTLPAIKYDAFGRAIEQESKPVVNAGLKPDPSVNLSEFAKQYKANPARWDKAFAYLKNTDFSTVSPGRYPIDGDDVFAVITLGPGKLADTTMWESHRNYEDIHYVISGREQIGIAPLSSAKSMGEYNMERDLAHPSVNGRFYVETPGTFFIITTKEAHKPGIKAEGYDDTIKKLYIKVRKS